VGEQLSKRLKVHN